MAGTPEPLQYQEIGDFSPGIHSENTSTLPPGAAHPDGTFGCFATADGTLAPLPRVTGQFLAPTEDLGDPADNELEEFRITGLAAIGPIFLGASGTQGTDENKTGVVIGIESWTNYVVSPSSADHNTYLYMYHRDFVTPVWDLLTSHTTTVSSFSFIEVIDVTILPTRSNKTTPALAGPVVIAVCEMSRNYMFPDDTNISVQASKWLPADTVEDATFSVLTGGQIPVKLAVHQGRLVTFLRSVTAFGDNAFYDTDEQFFWSDVNDISTPQAAFAAGGVNYFKVNVGWEHPTGYGVAESLTADELLLIKKSGGAWILRGDLDNFQAVNYPFVTSTGESRNYGTKSVKGFVYPVDSGTAWLWTGGQNSTEIAPQLADDFWRVPCTPATGDQAGEIINIFNYYTQCASIGVFTYFPNNWVWDSQAGETGAWWRIDSPEDWIIHRWSTDWRGVAIYGSPSGFTTDTDVAVYEYDTTHTPRSSFSWLSHPTLPDNGEVAVREIIIEASGVGTVTVTVFSAEDPTGQNATAQITGTAGYPTTVRYPIDVKGTQIQFQVSSVATDTDDAAPTVHRLRWGGVWSNQIPSS